jgi:serine/threonine protein kinase
MSSAGDFSSSSSNTSMKVDDPVSSSNNPAAGGDEDVVENAYWVQRTIREAIYGRVQFAVVLKRRPRAASGVDGAEWEVTPEHCAVKEMCWEHIRRERDRLAEDPIKEVAAMQYMKKWFEETKLNGGGPAAPPGSDTGVAESFQAMKETNIMMPLDLLSDDRNLYSVMPYCDGGELFERLDLNERFSEGEARYWMDQVINVSQVSGRSQEFIPPEKVVGDSGFDLACRS